MCVLDTPFRKPLGQTQKVLSFLPMPTLHRELAGATRPILTPLNHGQVGGNKTPPTRHEKVGELRGQGNPILFLQAPRSKPTVDLARGAWKG